MGPLKKTRDTMWAAEAKDRKCRGQIRGPFKPVGRPPGLTRLSWGNWKAAEWEMEPAEKEVCASQPESHRGCSSHTTKPRRVCNRNTECFKAALSVLTIRQTST